jgi:Domain of unknown function (DUF4956)
MLELFPDQPVYEYPQLINVIYCFAWAFVLSSIIAVTHRLTFTGEYYPKNFFQSLILGSIVTAMVMMAIGDSLARGLGVFGAMAIIRFRTRIDDPRDVLFLFAALSTGLAVGVYGFTVSFAGTILFCAIAALLHFSPFRSFTSPNMLFFNLQKNEDLPAIIKIIEQHTAAHRLVTISVTKEQATRYQYAITFHKEQEKDVLFNALLAVEGLSQPKITVNEPDNA